MKIQQPLVIFGSQYRDLVKLIGAINKNQSTWDFLGFIDDRPEAQGGSFFGYPVLGGRE
jgi:hypothetical protein